MTDPRKDEDGNDAREHHLWQVAGEVRLQRIDALDGGRRDLASFDAVESSGLCPQPALDERQSQVGEDGRGGSAAGGLEPPGKSAPQGEDGGQQDDVRPQVWKCRAVERSRHDPCKERGLEQNEQRGRQPDRDVGPEQ